jgi:hypothetical protein
MDKEEVHPVKFFLRASIFLAITFLVFSLSPANAAAIFVGAPGALGANDSYDWNLQALGPFASGTHLVSPGGVGFTVSEPQDLLSISNLSTFITSQGGTKNFLLGSLHDPQAGPIRLEFDTPVFGVGASMEWGGFEVAQYTITLYDASNAVLLTQTIDSGSQGDPGFVGALDDVSEIKAVTFTYDGPTAPHSIALSDVSFVTSSVPEPATFLLAGLGLIAGVMLRRRAQ